MTDTLFNKNVILNGLDIHKFPLPAGLDKVNRKEENNENYCSLSGTRDQIDNFLQSAAKDLIGERCRTLKNLQKFRMISSKKVRIQ